MNPVEDFLKEAGFWNKFGKGMENAIPGALANAALAAGAVGATKAYGAIKERLTKPRDYRAMLQADPSLSKEDAGNVQMLYNSLRSQAPTMARDPLISASFVRMSLDATGGGRPAVRMDTAKTLADAQRSLSQSMSDRGPIAGAFMAGRGDFR